MSFFDKLGRIGGKAARAGAGRLLVISHDFRPGELVWEYPQRMIPYGSRIVVQPNQAAIVIRGGKVLAVLRQGEWPLDTAHVPGLRGVVEELYEGVPLPVRIVFVNIVEKDIAFGGQGNTKDGVPVQYRGRVHVVVPESDEDIKKFAMRIAGEDKSFTTEELEERIRLYINDWVESFLGGFLSIDVHQGKARVKELLRSQAAREIQENWYLRVKSIAVDIDIPEEWLRKLQESGYFQMLALAATSPQVAQFMQQYDLQRRLMDALAKAQGGNVVGLAAFLPMLQQFLQQAQQPQPVQTTGAAVAATGAVQQPRTAGGQQGYTPRCPYCGKEIPAALQGARFCPYCGQRILWCSRGHVAPAEARFCPVCGAPLEPGQS